MGMNAYKCMICGAYESTHSSMANHYSAAHNANIGGMIDEKNAYKCHKCNTYKNTACEMVDHYRTKH